MLYTEYKYIYKRIKKGFKYKCPQEVAKERESKDNWIKEDTFLTYLWCTVIATMWHVQLIQKQHPSGFTLFWPFKSDSCHSLKSHMVFCGHIRVHGWGNKLKVCCKIHNIQVL